MVGIIPVFKKIFGTKQSFEHDKIVVDRLDKKYAVCTIFYLAIISFPIFMKGSNRQTKKTLFYVRDSGG